jgi:hypothetical protein
MGSARANWEAPEFYREARVFDWEAPVFDREVASRSEERLVVGSARTAVLRAGSGGLNGAARGPQPARAALRAAQGCDYMPPSRPEWVTGRCHA